VRLSDAIGVNQTFGRRAARCEGLTDNSGMWGGEFKVAELDGHGNTNIYTLP
jgi:hypothetical protein